MILKIDLYNLIEQPKHDCMSCPHPLLNIYNLLSDSEWLIYKTLLTFLLLLIFTRLRAISLLTALQIRSEMLEQSDLLVQLLRVVFESVTLAHVLLVAGTSLEIVEVMATWV